MVWQLIKAIVILPGTALVYVPGLIVWRTDFTLAGPADWRLWASLPLFLAGGALASWTMRLFWRVGKGTPAPWAPPQRLVVKGPYRHVRNPMITAVLVVLTAESLVFGSWPVAGWLAVFFIANNIYFPLFEEKDLEKRFGEDYRTYKAQVPRWIPRVTPWTQPLAQDHGSE